jgi:hypothetical protein
MQVLGGKPFRSEQLIKELRLAHDSILVGVRDFCGTFAGILANSHTILPHAGLLPALLRTIQTDAIEARSLARNALGRADEFVNVERNRVCAEHSAQNLTQEQLADELGVAQQVVASYDIGRRRVPVSTLPALARLLGISIEGLIGEDEKPAKRGPSPKLQRLCSANTRSAQCGRSQYPCCGPLSTDRTSTTCRARFDVGPCLRYVCDCASAVPSQAPQGFADTPRSSRQARGSGGIPPEAYSDRETISPADSRMNIAPTIDCTNNISGGQLLRPNEHRIWSIFAAIVFTSMPVTVMSICSFGVCSDPDRSPLYVYEYYDGKHDRFSLTISLADRTVLERAVDSTWTATALGFVVRQPGDCRSSPENACDRIVPACQFRADGKTDLESRFFTINTSECESLKRADSGWIFVGTPFDAWPIDPVTGSCPGISMPIRRYYNNRWREGESNHRYTAFAGVGAGLTARGWTDEGVAFCAQFPSASPVRTESFSGYVDYEKRTFPFVSEKDLCITSYFAPTDCIALNNLQTAFTILGPYETLNDVPAPAALRERTGVDGTYLASHLPFGFGDRANSFVQFFEYEGWNSAFFVTSQDGQGGAYTGLSSVHGLPPFYPFVRTIDVDTDLVVTFRAFAKTIETFDSGSHAYSLVSLVFADKQRHYLLFNILAFGTVKGTDFVVRDATTNHVIVATSFGGGSRYGRSLGLPTLYTPPGFVSANSWGWGGQFDFRMNAGEFQRVVADARTIDSTLSPSSGDYQLLEIRFKNEVFGFGELGMNLRDFRIVQVRPDVP